jgi:hypothetical protein
VPLTNAEYAIFALITLFAAPGVVVLTFLCWFVLPFHLLITYLLGFLVPVVRLLGREPTLDQPGSGPLVGVLFFCPLTLAPMHFLNFRVLGWPGWAYLLLVLVSWLLVAVGALYATGRRRWR